MSPNERVVAALEGVATIALTEIGVYICARLGYALALTPGNVAVVWPPAGFILAILLLRPTGQWPLILAGALMGHFAADLVHSGNPLLAVASSVAAGIQAVCAAHFARRFLDRPVSLSTARELGAVVIAAALVSNTATATLGALALAAGGVTPFGWAWFVWWAGNGLGIVIVAPAIIGAATLLRRSYSWRAAGEMVALFGAVVAAAWLLLGDRAGAVVPHTHPYMLLPLLFFVAVRLGPAGSAVTNLWVAAVALRCSALGTGPFATGSASATEMVIQLCGFLGLTGLCGLGAAVIIRERRTAHEDLRASQSERRTLEEQFRRAQKMEAVGQLAGGVAHDFNNLLTAILGYSGLLSDAMPEADERRAEVDEITRAAERAARLTQQLLAFSRHQVLVPKVIRMGRMVDEVAPMLRRLLGESIDLRSVVTDTGFVKVDGGQFEQVLMNLAVNARDAMASGGRLTVETGDVWVHGDYPRRHGALAPGGYVYLSVTDTGHGMSAETVQRIFEPFFTTKPVGQGTGLGLAVVDGIVRQSGGHLWVHSEVGHGTTFKVYLPRTDRTSEEHAMTSTTAPSGSETIMLIEDDDAVRRFVQRVLVSRGYVVHAWPTPGDAIEFMAGQSIHVDVIVTDVVLPNMSGPALVAQLRSLRPDVRVLLMSGYSDGALAHRELLTPDMAFLQKPFSAQGLLSKVRQILDDAPPQLGDPLADGAVQ